MEERFHNQVGNERIADRQIDELIGLARGIAADGQINQAEVEFLQKWLVANLPITDHPLIRTLYRRVDDILHDGIVDEDEKAELLDTLNRFSSRDFELGEVLKATSLPLCAPPPALGFAGERYTFTGTFTYGCRKRCEGAVTDRGADAGSLTRNTTVLVIGTYATESWKHSSFGLKILKACDFRTKHRKPFIVSEEHWVRHL